MGRGQRPQPRQGPAAGGRLQNPADRPGDHGSPAGLVAADAGRPRRDIAGAWEEYRQLDDGTHPSQRRFDGLGPAARLSRFLADARHDEPRCPASEAPAATGR